MINTKIKPVSRLYILPCLCLLLSLGLISCTHSDFIKMQREGINIGQKKPVYQNQMQIITVQQNSKEAQPLARQQSAKQQSANQQSANQLTYNNPKYFDFSREGLSASEILKLNFIKKIYNSTVDVNKQIVIDRNFILKVTDSIKARKHISSDKLMRLESIATKYNLDSFNPYKIHDMMQLLSRVNTVPPALSVAQAALESGWGKSRFAKIANNYYGHYCYSKGCGVVPLKRASSRIFEIRKFESVQHSVEAYIHNLNTHSAYEKLRSERQKQGANKDAIQLASLLGKYSEERGIYAEKVKSIIIKYNLS